ncbi:sugar kinase [Nanchangia anserum]|uniref:Sugar kinase n=1 Tax=Nanchangia anserum TaxID=2692125 RepID=A0A8I0KQ89_9ACTO|nr:FGGY family carbohydrate kinase [Nanchangia anserum]MBD3689720.1 sugar kinase [Nanchangia anserum]QOX81894.1 sugar kinase [Nanchangia anserum]
MSRSTRPLILALDLGTSGAKAALIDVNGDLLAHASSPYDTHVGHDGAITQEPGEWLRAAREAIVLVGADAGDAVMSRIAGLGLTGQMQDLVLLPAATPTAPEQMAALGEAILYADARAQAEADEISRAVGSWDTTCGNIQGATSPAAMWLRLSRTGDPRLASTRRVVFGPAAYLAWALGLGAWCDQTTATTTGIARRDGSGWLSEVCAAADLPPRVLPALAGEGVAGLGTLTAMAGELIGLPAGIPVVLAPGDAGTTTLGTVGATLESPYAYLGSSGWVGALAPFRSTLPAATRHCLAVPYAAGAQTPGGSGTASLVIAALASAGATAQWGRDVVLGGASAQQADAAMDAWERDHGRVPTGLLTLPGLGGERFPVRSEELAGAIIGIRPTTDAATLYRGLLEGIAFGLRHALDDIAGDDRESLRTLPITGGGAESEPWRRLLADIIGVAITHVPGADATLIGCALATAHALGLSHRIAPIAARVDAQVTAPDPDASAAYANLAVRHRQLYTAVEAL